MTDLMFEFIILAWFMGYLHRYMWKAMKAWYSEIKELNAKPWLWEPKKTYKKTKEALRND